MNGEERSIRGAARIAIASVRDVYGSDKGIDKQGRICHDVVEIEREETRNQAIKKIEGGGRRFD
jgi:hypothetical protein